MENRLSKMLDMLETYPNDSFLNYAIALEYWKEENRDKAKEHLDIVRENDPEYLATYYQLGKLLEEMRAMNEAIKIFDEGIKIAQNQKNQKTLEELQEARSIAEEG